MLLVLGLAGCFYAIKRGWIGYMPPLDELQSPINRYASQALSEDGVLLGTWSVHENRIFADYQNISPNVFNALIATEDSRFFEHSGIDVKALGRAVVKRGFMGQSSAGGGSTITQQLAKQLYSAKAGNAFQRMMQKPIEWVIAVELERSYTKSEILTLYLNYFDFLHNAVGIKTAANTYFGKQPADLTVPEAATLIGMCKNPSVYNPVRFPDRSRERRNVVLMQMYKYGYLSESEYEQYSGTPLTLKFKRVDHKDGEGTYLREHLRQIMMAKKPDPDKYRDWQKQKYSEDSLAWETDPLYGWCNKNKKPDGTYYNLYTDGLKVYTSVNSKMQKMAEDAVYKQMAENLQPLFNKEKAGSSTFPFSNQLKKSEVDAILDKAMKQSDRYKVMQNAGVSENEIKKAFREKVPMTLFSYKGSIDTVMSPLDSIKYYKSILRAAFVAMEPQTGLIKAYVGGIDYTNFQYDMVSDGRRQVGSTIKPFVYALAMENGMTPCDVVQNVQQTYMVAGRPWTPRNASRARYGEMVTLKWGLTQSNNWISAYLINRFSPQSLVSLMQSFGIDNPSVHPSLSLALGSCDVSLGEMASAYTAFANKGIRTRPMLVTRIEDDKGNVIATFAPQMHEVISEESSYKMLDMLRSVVDAGTGKRLRFKYNINAEMGGKTGTTNRNSDGWFMAVTPRLVCASWVGGENRDIRFNSMTYGQGASSALPIFALFMQKVYATPSLGYTQSEKFVIPEGFSPCGSSAWSGFEGGSDGEIIEEVGFDEVLD